MMLTDVDLVEVDFVVSVGNSGRHVVIGEIKGGALVKGIAEVEDGMFVPVEDVVILAETMHV
jgi:hypothetical protein